MAKTIVRPPGSISPDGRDFEVWYTDTEGGEVLDSRFRYLDQAEGRARYLLNLYPIVKVMQVVDYHANG